jgi:hypothetical protein
MLGWSSGSALGLPFSISHTLAPSGTVAHKTLHSLGSSSSRSQPAALFGLLAVALQPGFVGVEGSYSILHLVDPNSSFKPNPLRGSA